MRGTTALHDPPLWISTMRHLLETRRLVPILLVCLPLIVIQDRFTSGSGAVALAIAMCVVFVLFAPLSWCLLVPLDVSAGQAPARLVLYALSGCLMVLLVGVLLPHLAGIGPTYLTDPWMLVVCLAFYVVGGWGLGRDILHEQSLQRAQRRAEDLARDVERSHLMAIRSHLDPHFIFNSLNAIAEWCHQDASVAEQAILRLSTILRTILAGVSAPSWPLLHELELLRHVFAMHLVRDPELFTLQVEVAEDCAEIAVPPMILLALAENAVKHGPAAGHRGSIRLTACRRGSQLEVLLENPGPYRGPRVGSAGLPTLERRLALTYRSGASITLRPSGIDAQRTMAVLLMPTDGPLGDAR